MTQVISDERLREILAGCEGVTPGPWLDGTHHRQKAGDREFAPIFADGAVPVAMVPLSVGGYNDPDGPRNAAHIARLDPDTVRSIVTELLARRSPPAQEGMVLVPREPTEAMMRAGAQYGLEGEGVSGSWLQHAARYYRAMIAASPAPSVSEPVPAGYLYQHQIGDGTKWEWCFTFDRGAPRWAQFIERPETCIALYASVPIPAVTDETEGGER